MKTRLPENVYKAIRNTIKKGAASDLASATDKLLAAAEEVGEKVAVLVAGQPAFLPVRAVNSRIAPEQNCRRARATGLCRAGRRVGVGVHRCIVTASSSPNALVHQKTLQTAGHKGTDRH